MIIDNYYNIIISDDICNGVILKNENIFKGVKYLLPGSYKRTGIGGIVEMKLTTRKIVISGMLGAISIILGATGLGLIPVPTPAGHATIMHVPTIIGGVLEGPVVGFFIGLIFGIFSFIRATNPIFADPLIAILPRLLIGVGSYYAFYLLKKYNVSFALIISGVIGTVINTVFVLGLAVLRGYLPFTAAASVAVLHGIPEVILASVIVVIVGKAILSIQTREG